MAVDNRSRPRVVRDGAVERKQRGAFFTPPAIADFLAAWAIGDNADARVLDPTSGEGVFLRSAGRRLRALGTPATRLDEQVVGVDLHRGSLEETNCLLEAEGLDARLVQRDFFEVLAPNELFSRLEPFSTLGPFDAVIGNPPFVRYQQHIGEARRRSAQAALSQGVRLSGLASSWAALLVHAGAFLKPEGRIAMVLPAELLTVQYAEPVRRWLRTRFESVRLYLFETLQFEDALENVVLLLADGSGGSDGFSLRYVHGAEQLDKVGLAERVYTPTDEGKWTDLLLPARQRQLFKRTVATHCVGLGVYGAPELGTVTGANRYFALNDDTRRDYGLGDEHLLRISPPGTKHLRGLTFTKSNWETLRKAREPVWLLHPAQDDDSPALRRYVKYGEELGVDQAYKCQVRSPWWRPPVVTAPDLFFTYMSHRYPRLIANKARVTFLNSMHGVRLKDDAPTVARDALPLLILNSLTMLGAEIHGRSYGGGILKMEPREASTLPVPSCEHLVSAWEQLKADRAALDRKLRQGSWSSVVAGVDNVLLRQVMKLPEADVEEIRGAAQALRARRTRNA